MCCKVNGAAKSWTQLSINAVFDRKSSSLYTDLWQNGYIVSLHISDPATYIVPFYTPLNFI